MALIGSTRMIMRPGNGVNRFGIYFSGRLKDASVIKRAFATTLQRKSGADAWTYRRQNPRPAKGSGIDLMATGVMTFIYWWIFWHLFTEPGHVFGGSRFGEFDYPNPLDWTDEELGIPADDYEE